MVGRSARGELLTGLNALTYVGAVGNLSDAELLDRFLAGGGEGAEGAFEALVARHGPMVLDVCTNILRDAHDAQDAFQAAFLVLALRRGRSGGGKPWAAGCWGSPGEWPCGPGPIWPDGACTKDGPRR